MAQGIRLVCSNCSFSLDAWDEGNPYLLDRQGRKKYAYHPNPERDLCIGVDSPHLCLDCATEFQLDSRIAITKAPCCGSVRFVSTFELANHPCPKCRTGKFQVDPEYCLVS